MSIHNDPEYITEKLRQTARKSGRRRSAIKQLQKAYDLMRHMWTEETRVNRVLRNENEVLHNRIKELRWELDNRPVRPRRSFWELLSG